MDKNIVVPGAIVGVNHERDRELYRASVGGIIVSDEGQRMLFVALERCH